MNTFGCIQDHTMSHHHGTVDTYAVIVLAKLEGVRCAKLG